MEVGELEDFPEWDGGLVGKLREPHPKSVRLLESKKKRKETKNPLRT